MRKNNYKPYAAMTLAAIMAITSSLPAFAAWNQDAKGWRYQTDANTYHTNGWQWIDGNNDGIAECYYFGADGYMISNGKTPDGYTVNTDGAWTENGTVKTQDNRITVVNGAWVQGVGANAGKWWWKNTDGSYPKNCWQWLDGNNDGIAECYYFDADGWCVMNGKTPDGYSVDGNGAWLDGAKPITKHAKHAATTVKTTSGSVSFSGGGSSGGGGGSSSGGGSGSSHSSSSSSSSSSNSGSSSNQTSNGGSSSSSNSSGNTSGNSSMDEYRDQSNRTFFENGNWDYLKEDLRNAITAKIDAFKAEYITDDMSDFEKEIKIIQWIVQNCSYNKEAPYCHTAYGCIVNGKAVCEGYADAFLQMAKACGLEARLVWNGSLHAWNLVKLDGEWYHVDTTWEDPVSLTSDVDNQYGFNELRNKYINLTDDEMRQEDDVYHDKWELTTISANGSKYNKPVITEYVLSGTTPDNKQKKIAEAEAAKNAYTVDGKLHIEYTNTTDTENAIYNYLVERINAKASDYGVCVSFAENNNVEKVKHAISAIEDDINNMMERNYRDVINWKKLGLSGDKYKIAYTDGEFSYPNTTVNYTINYYYNEQLVSTKTETVDSRGAVLFEIPDGYEYDDAVTSTGKAEFLNDNKKFILKEDGTVVIVILKRPGETEATDTEDTKKDDTSGTGSGTESGTESGTGSTEATEKYRFTVKYTCDGETIYEDPDNTVNADTTVFLTGFEKANGDKYVPITKGSKEDQYEVKITENNMVIAVPTKLVKAETTDSTKAEESSTETKSEEGNATTDTDSESKNSEVTDSANAEDKNSSDTADSNENTDKQSVDVESEKKTEEKEDQTEDVKNAEDTENTAKQSVTEENVSETSEKDATNEEV